MAEFLLAAPLILLLGLGGIEAVHWYFARQAVSHALVQAARAASTQHAHPEILDTAFAQALLPFYAAPSRAASEARVQRAITSREVASGLPAWRIEILSPQASTFKDFASTRRDLPPTAHAIIDNDYLHEQHQERLAQGWHQGRGPASGQTTLQANTLSLRLTWLHEPLLPGVKQLLKQLASRDNRYGSLAMARAGYLPIQRQIAMIMQSHPIQWAMPSHGRVSRAGQLAGLNSGSTLENESNFVGGHFGCNGLWCQDEAAVSDTTSGGRGAGPVYQEPAPFTGPPYQDAAPGTGPAYPGTVPGNTWTDPKHDTHPHDGDSATKETWPNPDLETGSDPVTEALDDCPGCCD